MLLFIKKVLVLLVLVGISMSGTGKRAEAASYSKDYIDAYLTSIAAYSCMGVYLAENSSEYDYLRTMGWEVEPHVSRQGEEETHFSVAKHYFKDIGKHVFMVTFRGSATKRDWRINLKTKKVNYGGNTFADMQRIAKTAPLEENPGVHGGFNTRVDTVLADSVISSGGYLRGVFGYVQEHEDAILVLTGHSMGGAVATLLGTRVVDLGVPADRLRIITFGAPAIGNTQYNDMYANKLDILRITNTNDPVPGSLQTFFNGYTQCERNIKYHLYSQMGDVHHDMAKYFDHSVSELLRTRDAEVSAGRMPELPAKRISKGKPVVALWVFSSPGLKKLPMMPDLRRILIGQYANVLPSYIILEDKLDAERSFKDVDLISESVKAGADYVLLCGIDSRRYKDKNDSWYLTQDQALFDKQGRMLTMTSFSKRVYPKTGNIQAAGANYLVALRELEQHLELVNADTSKAER